MMWKRKAKNHLDNKDMMFLLLRHLRNSRAACCHRGRLVGDSQAWQVHEEEHGKLVKMDPEYYPAYYLLGTSNYFADVLPSAVKFFRSLLFYSGGDRNEGLRQLNLAYEKNNAVSVEAGRTMVLIQVYYEKAYPTGVRMADNVLATYPDDYEVGFIQGRRFVFQPVVGQVR